MPPGSQPFALGSGRTLRPVCIQISVAGKGLTYPVVSFLLKAIPRRIQLCSTKKNLNKPSAVTRAPDPLCQRSRTPKRARATSLVLHTRILHSYYRPGRALLTRGYTIGEKGRGEGRGNRALPCCMGK